MLTSAQVQPVDLIDAGFHRPPVMRRCQQAVAGTPVVSDREDKLVTSLSQLQRDRRIVGFKAPVRRQACFRREILVLARVDELAVQEHPYFLGEADLQGAAQRRLSRS